MRMPRGVRGLLAAATFAVAAVAFAQSGPPAAAAEVSAGAASAPAGAASAGVPPAGTAPDCSTLLERALAIDLAAAQAQAQRQPASEQARLLDESITLWQRAAASCGGRAQQRARRSLADTQRQRQAIAEVEGAGARCVALQKDAASMQDLGARAIAERRWGDAAVLFRRAESFWDLTAEQCTGAIRQQAQQRRAQSEIDAHNAEHCAPAFDTAREHAQKLRGTIATFDPMQRQTQLQIAETLWRDASRACKGPALETAQAQAQTAARDRGTAWVPTRPAAQQATAPAAAPGAAAPDGPLGTARTGARAGTGERPVAPPRDTGATTQPAPVKPPLAPARSTGTAASAPASPAPVPAGDKLAGDIVLEGGTRLIGAFTLDLATLRYSGRGRVLWPNGDRYEGDLVDGKRHGRGEFGWPSGQHYQGQWADDRPHGEGTLRFANGNRWDGNVAAGLPDGPGTMRYASGDSYTGRMRMGEPDGVGNYRWADGRDYDGPWTGGKANGRGVLRFPGGHVYEGEVQDGRPHGHGVYTWAGGQRYEGPWRDGQASGRGLLRLANGDVYRGDLVGGRPHGHGEMAYANGDRYAGSFVDGLPGGEGTHRWKNGDSYTGQWSAGRRDGRGIFTWASGDRWEGVYRNDAETTDGRLIPQAR